MICIVSGLQARSDMNGHEVIAHRYVANLGRFEVEDITNGELVRIKPDNLTANDKVELLGHVQSRLPSSPLTHCPF